MEKSPRENQSHLHQSLSYRTPDEVYFGTDPAPLALAARP